MSKKKTSKLERLTEANEKLAEIMEYMATETTLHHEAVEEFLKQLLEKGLTWVSK